MSTARELAAFLQADLTGDPDVEVRDVGSLEEARAGDAVFVTDARRLAQAEQSPAAVVVAPRNLTSSHKTLLKVDDPRVSFSKLVDRFRPLERPLPGIHASAVVSREARVAKTASVGALAVIEAGATVGENAVVGPHGHVAARASVGDGTVLVSRVYVGADCVWGKRGIAHPGVVVGADGFGFATGADGRHTKVRQLGNVVIGDDVEIGAGSAVDRGTFGSTTIGDGTKIDNLVHVAHNCRIGKNVLLAAQVGISGSCEIGDGAILLGQAGLKDHLKIGARAVIMPQSGIAKDVPPGVAMFGSPAFTRMQRERHLAALVKLPELMKRVKALEKGQ